MGRTPESTLKQCVNSHIIITRLKDICTKKPKTISSDYNLKKAVKLMQKNKVWDLPVTDKQKKLIGILHLHNALHHLY